MDNDNPLIVSICVICGKQITDVRDCNNPWPYPKELYVVKKDNNHLYQCCRSCNLSTVIPARSEPHFLDRLNHKALLKSRKDKLLKINEKV
jgi:hypothetical protein